MTYNDPQDVHSGNCATCDAYTPDNEDLSPDGLCDDCETEARLAALADAWDDIDADYTEALARALASPGVTPVRTDWLAVAAGIMGVGMKSAHQKAWAYYDAVQAHTGGCTTCGDDDEFSPDAEAFEDTRRIVCTPCYSAEEDALRAEDWFHDSAEADQ